MPPRIGLTLLLIAAFAVLAPRHAAAEKPAALLGNVLRVAVTVTGKVTDDTGSPLPGVNVVEKGTTNGAVTDPDGNYKITVSSNESVLVFSFVGMATKQEVVGTRTQIDTQLASDASALSEVVVIGYGTQEKRDVTGAVGSVKSEDFNRGIINSPEQLLQGKVAGVNITATSGEPGAPMAMTVRGPSGVRTGNTPLFVVDGVPLDNTTNAVTINPLNFLNPQDIESMDVLKDASATAIYGTRGSNGVVLITTKKGKAGVATVNYTATLGISRMARPLDVLDAGEYKSRLTQIGVTPTDLGADTDWQKEISRTGITQNHNLSLSGGTDKLTYYASLSSENQDGILKNSNMKRYSGRINLSQKLFEDRVTIDINLTASSTKNQRPPIEGLVGSAVTMNPTVPAYGDNGKPYYYAAAQNPLITLALNEDVTDVTRILGNISPSVKIIDGLVYKLNYGIDNANSVRDLVTFPSAEPVQLGSFDATYKYNNNNLIENYLTYNFEKGNHSFAALAGHSYQKIFLRDRTFSIDKFPLNGLDPRDNPGLGQDLTGNFPVASTTKNELQSFFGRVNYGFKDRYLFTATVRVDGSSKFGSNNKYGTFPSFSLGWRISDEAFMQSLPVSNLKLRAGWGQTGNQELPAKITQAYYTTSVTSGATYPLDGTSTTYPGATFYTRLANPNIQWEVTTQTNIGLDFGFLGGALSGSVDYFQKITDHVFLKQTPSDPIQPAPTVWANVPDMEINNTGVEVALNYQYKANSGITFNVGGNVTFIHNEVKNSPYTLIPSGTVTGSGVTSAAVNGYINGEPIGTYFLKKFTGLDENGMSTYLNLDGVGDVYEPSDKDRVIAGTALPKATYNFFLGANYKGFDFTVNFNGVTGNKIYDNTSNANFGMIRFARGVNVTKESIADMSENTGNKIPASTRFLQNGSFLRLNNAVLGYRINPAVLGLDRWVNGVRVSVTGQNLFLITDYTGYDPDVNTDKAVDGVLSYGVDYNSYPKARTVMFSLNVTF